MALTSVSQFAGELKVQPATLLEQLRAAGVNKSLANDTLTEQDKTRLLEYLRRAHGAAEAVSVGLGGGHHALILRRASRCAARDSGKKAGDDDHNVAHEP